MERLTCVRTVAGLTTNSSAISSFDRPVGHPGDDLAFALGQPADLRIGGTVMALAVIVAAILAGQLVLDFGASILATAESQVLVWPDAGELARSVAGGLLISAMWAAAGVLIGVLTRSPAIAVGLGLVWSFVVENLLRGVANLISGLEYVTDVLPGTAAGSMAGALGATAESGGDGASAC